MSSPPNWRAALKFAGVKQTIGEKQLIILMRLRRKMGTFVPTQELRDLLYGGEARSASAASACTVYLSHKLEGSRLEIVARKGRDSGFCLKWRGKP